MSRKIKKKIVGGTTISLLLLLVAFFILLHYPFFQTYLTKQAAKILSDKLQTTVKVGKVKYTYFSRFILEDIYIADDANDTLLYIQRADASLNNFALIDKKMSVSELQLHKTKFYIGKTKDKEVTISHILDRLSSGKSNQNNDKQKSAWEFSFGVLMLDSCHVVYNDLYHKNRLDVLLPDAEVSVKKLDIKNKICVLEYARLTNADIAFVKSKSTKTADSLMSKNMHFLGDFLLKYERIDINKSRFSYNDYNKEPIAGGIDYFHMGVNDIRILIEDGKIDHDTIFGNVKTMSCREKSGFILSDLTGNARVSNVDVTIQNMNLKTPHSHLQNYLRMEYDSFPDFKNFITKVRFTLTLEKSILSMRDLNYFSKGKLSAIEHNILRLDGTFSGKVNYLKGRNVMIETGSNTQFAGNITCNGLPNIHETLISADIKNLRTHISDVKRIYPALIYPQQLLTLGNVSYSGRFDGFINDFVSNGYITTQLGNATTDINVKYNKATPIQYSGHLITESFNIGKFINKTDLLGTVSLDARVKGKGLKWDEFNTSFDGTIKQIEVKKYNYKDIVIDGSLIKREFNGNLKIDDDNIRLGFKGKLNMDGKVPEYNFIADVKTLDLQALHLSPKKIIIKTNTEINFKGKRLDDFNGDILLNNLVIETDSFSMPLHNVSINTKTNESGIRFFDIESEALKININGVFSYAQLPTALRAMVNLYSLKPNTTYVDSLGNAQVNFEAIIYEPGPLSTLISKKFIGVRNSVVKGSFVAQQQQLQISATIPELIYDKFTFKQVKLDADFNNGNAIVAASMGKLLQKDSTLLKNISFDANNNGSNLFNFTAFASMDTFANRAELKGTLGYTPKKVELTLDDSKLYVNNTVWTFKKGDHIVYSKKYLHATNLILQQDDKDIFFTTTHPNDSTTNVEIDLSNINVRDVAKLIGQSKNVYFGKLDGGLEIKDIFRTPKYFGNIYVANLGVNNDTIGNVSMFLDADKLNGKIPIDAKLLSWKNDIRVSGFYEPKGALSNLDMDVKIARFDASVLNNFLQLYVTEVKGNIWGKIKVSGTNKKPILNGYANVIDGEATVAYINTHYKLKNEMVRFKENEIQLNNILLRDRNDNVAVAGGSIKHSYFKDFFFDVSVTANQFQMLSTTEKQNPIYWGDIYLSNATAIFQGPLKNIAIKVYGATAKNSKLTIPIRTTAETGDYSFYRFISFTDTAIGKIKIAKPKALLNVNIDVDVNELGELTLILDPTSGDRIKVNGNGNMKIGFNDNEQLIVRGDYTINEGNYLFTLQNIINKSFKIDKGSKITFNGNVYDAILDVDAVYSIRTSPYELIQDLIAGYDAKKAIASRRVPTDLYLILDGPLSKPKINFDVKLQNIDNTILQEVEAKLNTLRNNENERNRQAASLIVINSFFADGNSAATGNIVREGVTGTLTEFLSTQLSNVFSRLLGNFVKDVDVNIQYKNYNNESGGTQLTGNDIAIAVRKSFLNNKLTINVGGNVDIAQRNNVSNTRNNNFNGDFTIEYQITNDGRLRLKAFNRATLGTQQIDVLGQTGNFNSTGVGLNYREEFDDFADLVQQWRIRKENAKARKEAKKKQKAKKKS